MSIWSALREWAADEVATRVRDKAHATADWADDRHYEELNRAEREDVIEEAHAEAIEEDDYLNELAGAPPGRGVTPPELRGPDTSWQEDPANYPDFDRERALQEDIDVGAVRHEYTDDGVWIGEEFHSHDSIPGLADAAAATGGGYRSSVDPDAWHPRDEKWPGLEDYEVAADDRAASWVREDDEATDDQSRAAGY